MTDRELMHQALDALEWNLPVIEDHGEKEQLRLQHKSIIALRERLAKPEQELVIDCPRCGHCCPQRPWVGLTDEEIKEIIGPWGDTPIKGYTRKLFDQIEAQLKQRNT